GPAQLGLGPPRADRGAAEVASAALGVHDVDTADLLLHDLGEPADRRGLAAGQVVDTPDRLRPQTAHDALGEVLHVDEDALLLAGAGDRQRLTPARAVDEAGDHRRGPRARAVGDAEAQHGGLE